LGTDALPGVNYEKAVPPGRVHKRRDQDLWLFHLGGASLRVAPVRQPAA